MLGSQVDIDHSRQRQIGEKRPQSEDRDWSCFKVELSLYIVHAYYDEELQVQYSTYTCACACTVYVHVYRHCLHVPDVSFYSVEL